jgi:hypothetical protein
MAAVKGVREGWKFWAAAFMLTLIVGCGGDVSSEFVSPTGPADDRGLLVSEGSVNDIRQGLLTADNDPGLFNILLTLMVDGKFFAYGEESDIAFWGNYVAVGDSLVGEVHRWRVSEARFDGAGTFSAVTDRGELFVTMTMADQGASYRLYLDVDSYYQPKEVPLSLSAVQGSWVTWGTGAEQGMLTIGAAGDIAGHDANGCRYDGTIDVWNPSSALHLYKIDDFNVSHCTIERFNGAYTGWAFLGGLNELTYYLQATDAAGHPTYLVFNTIWRK